MIPIPWKLVGAAVGVALLAAILWWVQARIRVSYQAEQERDAAVANHTAYKSLVEGAATRAAARMELDALADADMNAKIEALDDERRRLAAAVSSIKPTVEKPDANGVPRVAIDPRWWLCVSTFVTRDPADAAACEADPSTGSLQNPVSR